MKNTFTFRQTITLMLLASALTLTLTLNFASVSVTADKQVQSAAREYAALLERINDLYIGDFDIEMISDAALRAVVYALGDRWSFYMTPGEYSEYMMSSRNQFSGIGVSVAIDESTGGMEVVSVYRDSPAFASGMLAGDIIVMIDGQSIAGYDLGEMRELLARPLGDNVEIEVLRTDGSVEVIIVAYTLIFANPISSELIDGDIGYIAIANFEGEAGNSFISAITELLENGATAFIFDVRNNNGGMVHEMTMMLDYLLPEGEIFVSVDKSGKEQVTLSDKSMLEVPAVVVVDRYSFSAAEYFAAILREYDYAYIVGEQTTGKSRSQNTVLLPNGGALHISTGQYFTKNRIALYDVGGLTPDYPLALTNDELGMLISGNLKIEDDPQLQLALSLLR